MPVFPPPPSGGGGGGTVVFQEEGSAIGTASILNFVGAPTTAAYSGGTVTVTTTATSGIVIQEADGNPTGTATVLVLPNGSLSISNGTATYTASGGGAMTYLGGTVLAGTASNIEITGLSSSYKDLYVTALVRVPSPASGIDGLYLRVGNGGSIDTGSNYSYIKDYNGGANTSNSAAFIDAGMIIGAAGGAANLWCAVRFEILNYASTSTYRAIIGQGHSHDSSSNYRWTTHGFWRNSANALDSIRLYAQSGGNIDTGSSLYVWGRT